MGEASNIRAGGAFVEIGAKLSRNFTNAIEKAKAKLDQIGAKIREIGAAFTVAGALLTAPFIKAIADAGALQDILTKFDAVFKDQAQAAGEFASALARSVGRAEGTIRGFLAALQDTFVPLGFARDQGRKLSQQLVQLAIDVASFTGRSDADVLRDFQSALVGQTRAVLKYGIVLTQSALDQEILNQGISGGVKNATELQKVMARFTLIMKSTTDAQGDAVRTAGSFRNQLKRLSATVGNLSEEVGTALLPEVTKLIQEVTRIANIMINWVQNNQETIVTLAKLAVTVLALGVAITGLGILIKAFTIAMTLAGAGSTAFGAGLLALNPIVAASVAVLIVATTVLANFTAEINRQIRVDTRFREGLQKQIDAIKEATKAQKELTAAREASRQAQERGTEVAAFEQDVGDQLSRLFRELSLDVDIGGLKQEDADRLFDQVAELSKSLSRELELGEVSLENATAAFKTEVDAARRAGDAIAQGQRRTREAAELDERRARAVQDIAAAQKALAEFQVRQTRAIGDDLALLNKQEEAAKALAKTEEERLAIQLKFQLARQRIIAQDKAASLSEAARRIRDDASSERQVQGLQNRLGVRDPFEVTGGFASANLGRNVTTGVFQSLTDTQKQALEELKKIQQNTVKPVTIGTGE